MKPKIPVSRSQDYKKIHEHAAKEVKDLDFILKLPPQDILCLIAIANYILTLVPVENKDYTPEKYVKKIAHILGIEKIVLVPGEECIQNGEKKHAVMNQERTIIFLNKDDDEKHHIFSIVHEICHMLLDHAIQSENLGYAARAGISWCVESLQKNVADEYKKVKGTVATEVLYDYITALVLMPVSLFLLHEKKTDNQLSDFFMVPIGSVVKRRKEVEKELDAMDSPSSASVDVSEVLSLLQIEEELGRYSKDAE